MELFAVLGVLLEGAMDAAASAAYLSKFAAGLGAGLAVIAAAIGIGRIGANAMEAISRQPESAKDIQSSMIISAALIEGIAFFALVVAFLILFV